jgi:hypothetical protein
MKTNLELDPVFDASPQARVKRLAKKILETRFLMIALLLHVVVLIIFGGKILFENYQKVSLESNSLLAPKSSDASPIPPPSSAAESKVDVKVDMPKNSQSMNKLATTKLSENFNVATPDIQNNVSISMDSGISTGGAGGGGGAGVGTGGGTGLANVNFFGIKSQTKNIVLCIDASASMGRGQKVGHTYKEVIKQAQLCLSTLSRDNEFNIILIRGHAISLRSKMIKGIPSEIKKAIDWLTRFDPENNTTTMDDREFVYEGKPINKNNGGTRVDLVLEKAIGLKPDVIMLISDGMLSFPDGLDAEGASDWLMAIVKKEQSKHGVKIPINTIYYRTLSDDENAKAYLKRLARDTKGEFKDIK